eukprot:508425_1
MTQLNANNINYEDDNKIENDDDENDEQNARYVTDIGLFGFGCDHVHKHLGAYNKCFKEELINTGYINARSWLIYLNKAMNKFKAIRNDTTYLAKRYSEDYAICRGDRLAVHHILALLIYTSESKLC